MPRFPKERSSLPRGFRFPCRILQAFHQPTQVKGYDVALLGFLILFPLVVAAVLLVVRNNRARSILVSTPRKVVVEGNTFSSMMSAILFEGDMDHWYESGAVRDVTIRNNRFLDGTYGGADFPTIFINPHQKKEVPGHPYERNITIEGNLFRTFNEQLLRAKSVGGLIFRDNTIELSEKYKPYNDLPTIDIRSSQQVVIKNNRYKKPGKISIVRK